MGAIVPFQTQAPPVMSAEIYQRWLDLVMEYSKCKFTKPEDKLIAFSGIAKQFQEATGDTYVAGFWRSYLIEGLIWIGVEPVQEPSSDYRAPSWSWASISGPLVNCVQYKNSEPLVEVIEVKLEHSSSDPIGPVLGGYLTLRGALTKAVWLPIKNSGNCNLRIGERDAEVTLWPDRLGIDPFPGRAVGCLPILSGMVGGTMATGTAFLVLTGCQSQGSGKWRRIGLFYFKKDLELLDVFGLRMTDKGFVATRTDFQRTLVTII